MMMRRPQWSGALRRLALERTAVLAITAVLCVVSYRAALNSKCLDHARPGSPTATATAALGTSASSSAPAHAAAQQQQQQQQQQLVGGGGGGAAGAGGAAASRPGPYFEAVGRGAAGLPPGGRVVVCVSSFEGRVHAIEPTIASIVRQSFGAPDRVYLSVPAAVARIAAADAASFAANATAAGFSLAGLEAAFNGTLKVLHPPDYGPATKLLGCLPEEPDPSTLIITMDDDVVYHQDTLGYLVSALVRLPPKLAASFVCETYNPLSDKYGWRGSFQDNSEGACHGFLAAYTGAGYRRSFFAAAALSDPIYNFTGAPDGCHVHDDVWISGNLFRRGIRPYVVGVKNGMWPQVSHRPYNKLSINSVTDMKGQQKRCLKHFNYFMEAEGA